MSWSESSIPSQQGRVAVVTGANGGLGLATAKALAGKGAHVVMAVRNQEKAKVAQAEILAATPTASLELVPLDLSSQASVKEASATVLGRHDRIDLLVNNAGVMAMPEGRTVDGFETQLGTNHFGHWTWTALLLPAMLKADKARVVAVTSVSQHQGRNLDPANPYLEGNYAPWKAYGNSKLANLHFAIGLNQRLKAAGASTIALAAHPGLTDSDLQSTTHAAGGARISGRLSEVAADLVGMSTERGALSQLRAATDPSAKGGTLYGPLFVGFGPPVLKPLFPLGVTEGVRRLWEISERETGVAITVPS